MNKTPIRLLCFYAAIAASPVIASTVFHESFVGDSATPLNGTAPDIRPGSEVWTAQTVTAIPRTDGTISSTSGASAWLPISLQSGYVYTVTAVVDISYNSGSTAQAGIGFTSDTPLSAAAVNLTGSGDYGILQARRNGAWVFYQGPNNHSVNDAPTTSAPVNTLFTSGTQDNYEIRFVLDTSGAQWTLAGYMAGAQVDLNGASAGLLYAYTTNPTITGVGINYGSSSIVFESFTVDAVSVIPEPSAASLLAGLGALGIATFGLRRKRA